MYNKKQIILIVISILIAFSVLIGYTLFNIYLYTHADAITCSLNYKIYVGYSILHQPLLEVSIYSLFQLVLFTAFLLKKNNIIKIAMLASLLFGLYSIFGQLFVFQDIYIKLLMFAPIINGIIYLLINKEKKKRK